METALTNDDYESLKAEHDAILRELEPVVRTEWESTP